MESALVKKSDIFIIILMILTIALFVWQKLGMNKVLTIEPAAHTPYLFTDNDYGGSSKATLTLNNGLVEFTCETEPSEITFPFCAVIIPLQPLDSINGLDLSSYNELHLSLEFQSSESDTVLVYLQNDEMGLNSETIVRASMSILTPNNELKLFQIPLSDFHLPSWWVFQHLNLTTNFEPTFENIRRIQVSTGDSFMPRQTEMSIHSIELHGKWINNLELYTTIIFVWFIYVTGIITFKIFTLRQSQTKANEKAEELETLNESLEQSVTAKDMFLSNMSHEIRTPMNGIYGTLQLLKQNKLTGENRDLINKAIYSTQSLLRIINDILDFSKIESGKLEVESVPFSLINIVESVISDFYPVAIEKGVLLESRCAKDVTETWSGDPVRIKQILINLVSNAVKFTQSGKVTLEVRNASKDKKQAQQLVEIKVTDTGIGMSETAITRLFERFEQADNSTTRAYGGTGLGMSITYSLIELMSGEINVESQPDQGSTFTVLLPLFKSTEIVKSETRKVTIKCPKVPNKTILIVEDNQVNLILLKKMLVPSEATLIEAYNGEEAIALNEMHHPDLILMDIQMPVMDGKDACQILRESNVTTPIIAFTANVLEHEKAEYLRTGFNDFLAKPLELADLHAVLNEYLANDN